MSFRMVSRSIGSLLLAAVAVAVPGCGGCASDKGLDREAAAEARAKAEAERLQREKEPFLVGNLRIQPYDVGRDATAADRSVKPGHWTSGVLSIKANHDDFSGQLRTEPLALADVPYRLSSTRPLVLSKAQPKTVDTLFFVPVGYSQQRMSMQLVSRRGSQLATIGQGLAVIPAQQFFFVVLAREPDRYGYLKGLDFATAPSGRFGSASTDAHYRIVLPRARTRIPLSGNPLAWTQIAYLLWDDQNPAALTLAQQSALVDWLHWGGQVIFASPESLSGLKGSFFEPYLPATSGGKLELTAELLAPLADEGPQQGSPLATRTAWAGESLQPHPAAEIVLKSAGGVPLVVERRVGNGRVVVTAFHLGRRELVAWDGNDAFLNRFILRRPPRQFAAVEEDVAVEWRDGHSRHDSGLVSRLRYFSRDADMPGVGTEFTGTKSDPPEEPATDPASSPVALSADVQFEPERVPRSVAAWNSQSDVAELARQAVREATRIEIPNAAFVVRMLALYLLVLVPVNWLVFRTVGRVEWAWIAAPLIALVGAVVVVRAAQLDIGFVRAKNELAILELFADHPRGHLTRYTTLYTSLSTDYDLHYSAPTALAQPFPLGVKTLHGQTVADLELFRGEEVVLRGMPVASNSIGIVHSEQMFDLGGAITIAPDPQRPEVWRVSNGTRLTLQGTGVLRPDAAAWIGTLKPGRTAAIEFTLAPGGPEWASRRRQTPETAEKPTSGATHLRALVDFAEAQRQPGQWRLVAWTGQELSGVTIKPRADQSRQATVIVAHLRPDPIPLGDRDQRSRVEIEESLKRFRVLRGDSSDPHGAGAKQPGRPADPAVPNPSPKP